MGGTRQTCIDLADALGEGMQRYRVVPPNLTVGILVRKYGRRKQFDRTVEW